MRKTIYDYAIGEGICTPEGVGKAREYAKEQGCSPQKALVDTAIANEADVLSLLGKIYRFKTADCLKSSDVDKELISKFDSDKLISMKMIPCQFDQKLFTVAIANPNNSLMIEDYIKEVIGDRTIKMEYILISENTFVKNISTLSKKNSIVSYDLDSIEDTSIDSNVYDVNDNDISVIVSIVNKIFSEAVRTKASDIHIEPFVAQTRVRFRVDGDLTVTFTIPKKAHHQLIGRVKTMANMDVNTTRLPQDGRIRLKHGEAEIDMRVSTLPTVHGEKINLRLLDQNSMDFDIDMMCFDEKTEKKFTNIIERPQGIVLMTGPTGSGKSTSLYAVISHLNKPECCIVTLEQPVEYRIDGVVQVQIDEGAGLTFAGVLREVLRQDPNIILIGEIRDVETARTAMGASNTGHQVFSTLHTNSASSAVVRLIEMGIEPYLVSDSLNAVVNQRLVRRICPNCKYGYEMPDNSSFRALFPNKDRIKIYKGKGCEECNGTGYRGRIAVQELLVVDNNIKEALSQKIVTAKKIEDIAIKNGMKTMLEDGIEKSLLGLTTLDEIHKKIHFDNL